MTKTLEEIINDMKQVLLDLRELKLKGEYIMYAEEEEL